MWWLCRRSWVKSSLISFINICTTKWVKVHSTLAKSPLTIRRQTSSPSSPFFPTEVSTDWNGQKMWKCSLSCQRRWPSFSTVLECETPQCRKLRWNFNYPPVCWDESFPVFEGKRAELQVKMFNQLLQSQWDKAVLWRAVPGCYYKSRWLFAGTDNGLFLQDSYQAEAVSPHLTSSNTLLSTAQLDRTVSMLLLNTQLLFVTFV